MRLRIERKMKLEFAFAVPGFCFAVIEYTLSGGVPPLMSSSLNIALR